MNKQQKSRQGLSLQDLLLQPWFLDKRSASAIRKVASHAFLHKMRFYF
jgi:hypothetical protein